MGVLTTDCPHCDVARVGFTVMWSYNSPRGRVGIGSCGACRMPITFLAGTGASLEQYSGELREHVPIGQIWPEISNVVAPKHTPLPVARRFVEGEENFKRGSWNSAVAMYRSALDITTKSMPDVPTGKTFYSRLVWLRDEGRITQQMKDWADHVRVEGNDALHEPDEFIEEDARPLRLFTETFLRYVYELPGEVAAFRGETPDTSHT